MSTSSPTGPHEESTGDQAPKGAPPENPLLAFGSEGGDPASTEWPPAEAKSGRQRLAEMSWSADKANRSARAGTATAVGRIVALALVLACVLVAAYLYAEPVRTPMILPDVEHPRVAFDLIQPIPVPLPSAMPEVILVRPPAAPAPGSVARAPADPSRSGAAAPGASRPGAAAGAGSLSINARPWADVWIDGQSAGQTPIANLQVPVGTHEILFRHPQLGERRQTVEVSNLAPTRISIDLRD